MAVVVLTAFFWRVQAPVRPAWLAVGLLTVLSCLADWYLLARLPRLRLSFGRVNPPVFMINFIRLAVLLVALALVGLVGQSWQKLSIVIAVGLFQVAFLAAAYIGLYVEPFRLTLTEVPVSGAPAFFADRPLRILQLSDVHMEHITKREKDILAKTEALAPDMIVMTGDFLNKSYRSNRQVQQEAREWLAQLSAPYGVFAVNGDVDTTGSMKALFDGLTNIRVLHDEIVTISFPGASLHLVGALSLFDRHDSNKLEGVLKNLPANVYSLVIYHYPEGVEVAAKYGVNLMLAGDTHGGQIRLPLIGSPLVKMFSHYEMGKYQVGPTMLYVSRGLGMQGGMWPRMRLNCPPEMVMVEIGH